MTKVVTFYSYKGGVGRTMALVNVAHALAHRGLRVLMVDLDLEAPGMTHFFVKQVQEHAGQASKDALDLLLQVKRSCTTEPRSVESIGPLSLTEFVVPIPVVAKRRGTNASAYLDGRLDLLPAPLTAETASSSSYLERLQELDLPGIFSPKGPGHHFGNAVRQYLEAARFPTNGDEVFTLRRVVLAAYDLILVDSRTGLNESSGLCVGPLCDALVVCTGLNEQNVSGTEYFLQQAGLFDQEKSKKFAVVVGPVPPWSRQATAKRLERIGKAFHAAKVVAEIPYHPAAALGEPVFVSSDPGEPISTAYQALAENVIELTRVRNVEFPHISHGSPAEWDTYQREYARSLSALRVAEEHFPRARRAPRPFPTAVAMDALHVERTRSAGSIAVAAAVAALRLKSAAPFNRLIEMNSANRSDELSASLLFMRLRIIAELPLATGEEWVLKLIVREPRSEAHAIGIAYAAALGIPEAKTSQKREPHSLGFRFMRHWAYTFEPPLFDLLNGEEPRLLEYFFKGSLPRKAADSLVSRLKRSDDYFEHFRVATKEDMEIRGRETPPGLWPIPFMIGVIAMAKRADGIDDVLRWLELCQLVHGYAWRVLVDWRHLEPVRKHRRFKAFVREEDERVAIIESAIDRGEYSL